MDDVDGRLQRPAAEETVEYAVFLLHDAAGDGASSTTGGFDATRPGAPALLALQERIATVVRPWVRGYLWHTNRFTLGLGEVHGVACLTGRVAFGDGAEDEWFVVAMLRALTQVIPNIAVRVVDGDGQFMLIEAADILPEWMDPCGMDNRVFLHMGGVHIISPTPTHPGSVFPYVASATDFAADASRGDPCPDIPLGGAVAVLAKALPFGMPHPAIDRVVAARVRDYNVERLAVDAACGPWRCLPAHHAVAVQLPTPLAAAFAACPHLIAPAVRLATDRTGALAASGYQAMAAFAPGAHGFSRVTLHYTRLQHAMLSQCELLPPAGPFPHDLWGKDAAGCLGAKLACGAEGVFQVHRKITRENARRWGKKAKGAAPQPPGAVAEAAPSPPAAVREEREVRGERSGCILPQNTALVSPHDSLALELERTRKQRAARASTPAQPASTAAAPSTSSGAKTCGWDAYLSRLKRLGWFGDDIEGSQRYREREAQARAFFEKGNGGGSSGSTAGAPQQPDASTPALAHDDGAGRADGAAADAKPRPAWAAAAADAVSLGLSDATGHPCVDVLYDEKGAVVQYDMALGLAVRRWLESEGKSELPESVAFEIEADSSEAWMNVAPGELDAMLANRFSDNVAEDMAQDERRQATREAAANDFATAAGDMKTFLTVQRSDHRGVAPKDADATTARDIATHASAGGGGAIDTPTHRAGSEAHVDPTPNKDEPDEMPSLIKRKDVEYEPTATAAVKGSKTSQPKPTCKERKDGMGPDAGPEYGSEADSDEDGEDYVPPVYATDPAEPVTPEWRFDVKAFETARRRLLNIPEPPAGEADAGPTRRAGRQAAADDGSSDDESDDADGMYADLGVLTEQELKELHASQEYMQALNEELKHYEHLDRNLGGDGNEDDERTGHALAENLLESLRAQHGQAGPVSTMMSQLRKESKDGA